MTQFKPGDRVLVPWGLDDVLGTVEDVFGPPNDPFVRVRIATENDVLEVPVKASLVRPAPPGSIEVTAVRERNGRVTIEVTVHGLGPDKAVEISAPRDDAESLRRTLGDEFREELAVYATQVVASIVESGKELADHSILAPADFNRIVTVHQARHSA